MIDIKPFKGIFYPPTSVKKCIAPPYDEISHILQDKLHKKNKHNIVRIVRGKEYPQDSETDNKYTRAKKYFDIWLKNNIFLKSKKECIYFYSQEYKLNNKKKERKGIISLLRLQSKGKGDILPHEGIRLAPMEDQFLMLKETKAHFSPVFFLYSDKENKVMSTISNVPKKLLFSFEQDNVYHKLYEIQNESSIHQIANKLKNKKLIIADGHHRYFASLKYQKETGHNFILSYLTRAEDEGLDILTFHRYVKVNNLFIDAIFKQLSEYFYIEKEKFKLSSEKEINKMLNRLNILNQNNHTFGMYLYKNFYFLKLKDKNILKKIMQDKSNAYKNLPTSILQKLVLENIFGQEVENISYLQDANYIIKDINKNKSGIAFFAAPPTVKMIEEIIKNKEIMPPKSTYFYPKVYSGLVIYHWG